MEAQFSIALFLLPGVLLGLLQLLATKSVSKWGALIVSFIPSLLLLVFSYAAFVKGREEEEIYMRGETSAFDGWLLLTWFIVSLPFLLASILITLRKHSGQKHD
jgi:hypothetical protein